MPLGEDDFNHILSSNGAGYFLNLNQGFYKSGKSYLFHTKLRVAARYKYHSDNLQHRPNLTKVAEECQVSRWFVTKVESELLRSDDMTVKEDERNKTCSIPGYYILDPLDYFVILLLYREEPSRILRSYVDELYHITGVEICKTTVSEILKKSFPNPANLRNANIIPLDQFRHINIERANIFANIVRRFPLNRVIFFDKKLLKNAEGLNRRNRRDPITAVVPTIMSKPDFRNTYKILGMSSIDKLIPCNFYYKIHSNNDDQYEFVDFIFECIENIFIREYDVVIGDRAPYHTGGINKYLEDILWENHHILLLWLPARTPEWNPVELMWSLLQTRLGIIPLKYYEEHGNI